ncbi:hypothetical protein ACTXT7_001414 [Hymenolepis weldensis]
MLGVKSSRGFKVLCECATPLLIPPDESQTQSERAAVQLRTRAIDVFMEIVLSYGLSTMELRYKGSFVHHHFGFMVIDSSVPSHLPFIHTV